MDIHATEDFTPTPVVRTGNTRTGFLEPDAGPPQPPFDSAIIESGGPAGPVLRRFRIDSSFTGTFHGYPAVIFVSDHVIEGPGPLRKPVLLGLSPPAEAGGAFVERTFHLRNPLPRLSVESGSRPAFADLDADGDLDLFSGVGHDIEPYPGARNGAFYYFENTGSVLAPAFLERTGSANPLDGFDVGYRSAPAFADLDADGDLDALSGEHLGNFHFFENTGSATSPAFAERTGSANPLDGFATITCYSAASTPTLADLDDDGDLDVAAGSGCGVFAYFENTGSAAAPAFVERSGVQNPFVTLSVGRGAHPALADLNDDGDFDLVSGEGYGSLAYFENVGTASVPVFSQRTGSQNPLDGFQVPSGYYSAPAVADLDGDGDLDVASGIGEDGPYDTGGGRFVWLENVGSAASPSFAARSGSQSPLDGLSIAGDRSAPALCDLDGDGDLDAVAGGLSGSFAYFENTGTPTAPGFVLRSGSQNPLGSLGVALSSRPALADLDGDADLDLVSGRYAGTFAYLESTGTTSAPAFALRTGTASPLSGLDAGLSSTPALTDLDGDGTPEVVAGESFGRFAYLERQRAAALPLPRWGWWGALLGLLAGLPAALRRRTSRCSPARV